MPHTNAWNEATPAGSDQMSTADDHMRQIKLDVRERMSLEHVWNSSTTNDGRHKAITIALGNNESAISMASAGSVTGSGTTSLVVLSYTWNTVGNPTAFKLDVTKTSSGGAGKLLDLLISGVSQFNVSEDGAIAAGRSLTLTHATNPFIRLAKTDATARTWDINAGDTFSIDNVTAGNTPLHISSTSGVMTLHNDMLLNWSGRGNIKSPSDGFFVLSNNAGTSQVGLLFTTNGKLQVRDNGDSADAELTCGAFTASGPSNFTSGIDVSGGIVSDGSAGIDGTFDPTTLSSMEFKQGVLVAAS